MKKIGLALLCVLCFTLVAKGAEKSTIIVKTYTNVLVDATNGYVVNPQGDLVTYNFSTGAGGELNRVTYTFYRKKGDSYNGEIESTYFPANAVDIAFIGLERNSALVLFTTLAGDRVYMMFRLRKTESHPTPSKTDFTQKVVAENEECSLSKNEILLKSYSTDARTNLIGIQIFNHKWKSRDNKGIDFNPTHGVLTPINPPVEKYYKGVIDRGGNLYDIQILKP